jgi:hypothetical protein
MVFIGLFFYQYFIFSFHDTLATSSLVPLLVYICFDGVLVMTQTWDDIKKTSKEHSLMRAYSQLSNE